MVTHLTAQPLLESRHRQGPPRAACTADTRAWGPTSSGAAHCPKPGAWLSGSQPVSPAMGPAPAAPGTSSLVPSSAENGPTGHQQHRALLGRRLTAPRTWSHKAQRLPNSPSRRRPRTPALGVGTGPVAPPPCTGKVQVSRALRGSSPSGASDMLSRTPAFTPPWGRYAIFKARAAEQGRNTSAHTAMLATPP
ncbi:hypothetical protein NDU88_005910 [Pleurodeles waltl]|uniref:Uncharacterized protein n=1 Tax=Pleurodeles waltl TaxID=8319 RepID=A0AAV7LQE6_PLEWA|nr:hypothetical protein NDU88_005910 [Pleurodeles waltl]